MAKVLQNFLIGVGLDTEKYDKGAKNVEGSLGRMRTLVGFTGAAITGAFALAGTAAIGAGKRVDDFVLATEGLKTSRQYVYDYGRALAALGGNADDAVTAIKGIEKAQSDFALKGMLGPLEDVALAKGDISALSQTQTGEEFLRTLAGMVPQMTKDQQRLTQDALGLPDSVMRSLRGGVEQFDAAVTLAHNLAGNLDGAVQSSREFNYELAQFNTRMEGIGNTLAQKILPGFTGVLQSMGGFLDKHKETINQALGVAGENPAATALLAGGGATAGAGVAVRGLMPGVIGTAGARLARLGGWGALAGAGLMAGDMAVNGLSDEQRERFNSEDPLVRFAPEGERDPSDFFRDYVGKASLGADYTPGTNAEGIAVEPDTWPPKPNDPYSGWVTPYDPAADAQPVPRDPYSGIVEYPEAPALPVYSGGEVSNTEAAQASPDVIMLQDQRLQVEKPAATPRINVQNNLEVKMDIDGRAIDSRVVDVIERRERDTQDDITSSVDR
ncbi:hypothetical protein ACMHYO_14335 [Allopusillimonas ginsengisoli]|uniref:hypothetical protein n=1 Tax=Allopusillimonas ginsengisoli TaxID=453575 RepID=UPI0039C1E328